MIRFFQLLTFLFSILSFSQNIIINGIVKNFDDKSPLPFAKIKDNNGKIVIADSNGEFSMEAPIEINSLSVSYTGFETIKIPLTKKEYYNIHIKPIKENSNSLEQGKSIINSVIKNKSTNNPEKILQDFEFESYTKLIISANPDSIKSNTDSIFNKKKTFIKIDSSQYKLKKLIDIQHIYQTEKISKHQYSNDKYKETIFGIKMAGLKLPIYEYIGLQLGFFSVYDDQYNLLGKQYDSPLNINGTEKYIYKLLDSIPIKNRICYIVYFENKPRYYTPIMEGLFYIDKENFAVAGASINIKKGIAITSNYDYSYLPEKEIWFPIKRDFKLKKGIENNIHFFKGNLRFAINEIDSLYNPKEDASNYLYLLSETTYSNLQYNIPIAIEKPNIAIKIKEDAFFKTEEYWNSYRTKDLDQRDQHTYRELDSILGLRKIEDKILFCRRVTTGYLPISVFDFDLRQLLKYNNHEGFRVGIGGETNDNLSSIVKLKGYSAYGLKDHTIKYSIGSSLKLTQISNSWIGFSYTDDIKEIGSTTFAIDKGTHKIYDPRPLNITYFYNHKTWNAYFETKFLTKTNSLLQLNRSFITPLLNYSYIHNSTIYKTFTITSLVFSMQWNPFSEYMETPSEYIEYKKGFPRFIFQFTQSLPNVFGNDFNLSILDFKMSYEKKYFYNQKTSISISGGYALGDIPLTHLYNTFPNNLNRDGIVRRITFAGKSSFETMHFNEFFSNKFLFFELKHRFQRITLIPKTHTAIALVTRTAWGSLDEPGKHQGILYKTLEDGYIESGIEFNQLFKGFGLAGFYRYGPNQLPHFDQNISIKFTFILDLGF